MRRIWRSVLFFFMFSLLKCQNECERIFEKSECIQKEGCGYVENSYENFVNKECLFIENSSIEKFCKIFNEMNKEDNFKTISCENKDYKLEVK